MPAAAFISPSAYRVSQSRAEGRPSETSVRPSSTRASVGRDSVERGDEPSLSMGRQRCREGSCRSISLVASILRLVDAGDWHGIEHVMSRLSSSQRTACLMPDRALGSVSADVRSPILVAIRRGELPLIETILKHIPEGQVIATLFAFVSTRQIGEVLMSKNESDGRTALMLAAIAGDVDIFNAVASRLQRAQMLEHLSARCTRGNTIFGHGVVAGSAAMIKAVIAQYGPSEVLDALCVKNFVGETPLMHAARARDPGAFSFIASILPRDQLDIQLEMKTEEGQTALAIATRAGSVTTWTQVTTKLTKAKVARQLSSPDIYGETAIMLSVRSRNRDVFDAVVGQLSREQVAVACGADSVLAAMVRPAWVSACRLDSTDESEAQLTALDLAAKPPAKLDMILCLLACGATPAPRTVLRLVRNCNDGSGHGGHGDQMGSWTLASVRDAFLGAITASQWAKNPLIPGVNLSVALMEAARQSSDFRRSLKSLRRDVDNLVLEVLAHLPDTVAGFDRFKAGGCSAGIVRRRRLSKLKRSLTGQAHSGREGNQVSLSSTIARGVKRKKLLDTAEVAPEAGWGITLVQEMMEPELAGLRPRYCAGPLAQAVQFRHLEFMCTPLVVDYLRLKFSAGLPNPFRETKWRREHGQMGRNLRRFMLDDDESKLRVYILQGGCADSPSWTYLPGLQFILAGLAGRTAAFYGVPAMRLALDVVVYMGVISVFVLKVVVLRDAGVLTPWEFLWLGYVLGAVWQQVREVQEAGSVRIHFSNPWNVVETTTLVSLLVAIVFRAWAFACDGHEEWLCGELSADELDANELNEVYLAQYFQAASAPFVLGKVLFLTQIHSSLGPLMHSTFRMFTDLARFGAMMLVIVLGFALGFYSMFGSTSAAVPEAGVIADFNSYYSSMLTLFAAMLGNFDFSIFSGAPMEEAGMVLLVFFLCVMNITLLNLLIAILSTAHARVEGNADKEAVLSEALIITQYRRAMRSDSLPSPLNIPQELISHLLWRRKERTKELVARGVFWLISGPVAIAITALLWAVSLPLTLAWAGRVLRSSGLSMMVPSVLGVSFNLGIAPLVTAWLWLLGIVGVWRQDYKTMETSDMNEIEASRAHRRGTQGPGSSIAIAKIASAAVLARNVDACAPVAIMNDPNAANLAQHVGGHQGTEAGGAKPGKSRLWQRAAALGSSGSGSCEPGFGDHRVTMTRTGFSVVTAIRAVHGVTVLQLKEALDGEPRHRQQMPQQETALSEALADIRQGQDRLKEEIRRADEGRAKLEAHLRQLIHSLEGEHVQKGRGGATRSNYASEGDAHRAVGEDGSSRVSGAHSSSLQRVESRETSAEATSSRVCSEDRRRDSVAGLNVVDEFLTGYQ